MVLDFKSRLRTDEMMDAHAPDDVDIRKALRGIRAVNAYLGGYAATRRILDSYADRVRPSELSFLDLGAGLADTACVIIEWAESRGIRASVTAVERNPTIASIARQYVSGFGNVAQGVTIREDDALALPDGDGSFDIATASLMLHHMDGEDDVRLVREMRRLSRRGIIINDLHRNVIPYITITAIAHVLPAGRVFRNDGPVSVRRSFVRSDLDDIGNRAGLANPRIRWHWPYRWTMDTLGSKGGSADG